jgi:hypothetical protein
MVEGFQYLFITFEAEVSKLKPKIEEINVSAKR